MVLRFYILHIFNVFRRLNTLCSHYYQIMVMVLCAVLYIIVHIFNVISFLVCSFPHTALYIVHMCGWVDSLTTHLFLHPSHYFLKWFEPEKRKFISPGTSVLFDCSQAPPTPSAIMRYVYLCFADKIIPV